MMKSIYNFSAGPAILHPSVVKATSDATIEFQDTGMSLMEMSHRSQRGPRTGPWFAQPWEGDRRAKTLQPLSHSRAGFRNAVGAHPDFFLWWKSWLMAL